SNGASSATNTTFQMSGERPERRLGHSCTLVTKRTYHHHQNETKQPVEYLMYVFGGAKDDLVSEGAAFNDMYTFNIRTRHWTKLEASDAETPKKHDDNDNENNQQQQQNQVPSARMFHAATRVHNKIYIFG